MGVTTRRLAALAVLLVAAGCRVGEPAAPRYVPSAEAARRALATALDSWVQGKPPGPIASASPRVVLVDNQRRPGQALKAYEILGEVPAENVRSFSVRLDLAHPDEQPIVRFVVFGIDPLWVFREEDYDMIAHWEHPMSAADEATPARDEPGDQPTESPAKP